MSSWHYIKKGVFNDETVGPISDEELLRLSFEGKVNPETLVTHPTNTKNQWTALAHIPTARSKFEEGKAERQKEAAANKARLEQQRAEKKAFKEQLKRQKQLTQEAERQAAAAENLRRQEAQSDRQLIERPEQSITHPTPEWSMPPSQVQCPFCREMIVAAAKKCKHCGEFLDPTLRAAEESRRTAASAPQVVLNVAGGSATAHASSTAEAHAGTGCGGCGCLIALAVIVAIIIVGMAS